MASGLVRGETGSAVAAHIAQVAARLFAARGYDATSVRAIVEAAGVTKPTLYYHFGSKEGLAQALFTTPLNRLIEGVREALSGPGEPVARLEEMVEAHFAFAREDPDRARFVFALYFGPLGSGLAADLMQSSEAMTRLWAEAARNLAEAGLVAPERARACATALRGLIVIHTMDYLYRGSEQGPELGPELGRQIVGDLLLGFGKTRRDRE
jgi:AcrR family transcriptional regulator